MASSGRDMEREMRDLACSCIGKATASRNAAALKILGRSLEPGERVESIALCGQGITSAGIAGVTDRRILFVSRANSVTDVPYRRISAVHRAWCAPQPRVRVIVEGAKPLHLVSKLGLDVAAVIQRHMATLA